MANSQTEISEPVKLNGIDSTKKQIVNLSFPKNKNQAINANAYYTNYVLYANSVTGADTLNLTFNIPFEKYYTGMVIYFKAISKNSGSVFINTNSLGIKELKVYNRSLLTGEIVNNKLISALYNGINFDMITEPSDFCPLGFIKINNTYCIEADERDSLNFYDANVICGDLGARLCKWSEWFQACNESSFGILNMVGNFEWIDDAGNYISSTVGAKVAGDTDCTASYSQNTQIINKRKYRCCYNR